MMRSTFAARLFLLSMLIGGLDASTAIAAEAPLALVGAGRNLLEWTPMVDFESITLSLADPQGLVRIHRFDAGEAPVLSLFDAQGMPLPDGTYTWELRVAPRRSAGRPSAPLVQSGYFTISNGGLVAPDLSEPPEKIITSEDQMVPDDLIVDGKGCIGLGCANNEVFFGEALRLKQSVVRLRFEDTSVAAGIPSRDWQLTINDAASGGADRFSIDDLSAGTTPFTVRGGAPSNSLYVDGVGNVGLGTATPAQDLHVASGSTPTVRLEHTGGTVRTWDVGASNTSFFVKDVTNASKVPFRIGAGAPANSMEITSGGFVGLGTASPESRLHIRAADPGFGTKLLVESIGPPGPRELFELRNNGGATFIFEDTTVPERWGFGIFSDKFLIDNQANGGLEYTFGATGNLTIVGNLTAANFPSSSRELKQDFAAVDPGTILAKLVRMPVTEWTFKDDPEQRRHIGPTVEDFSATFGLGTNGHSLVVTDVNGVSLAAIQGLHALVEEQRQMIGQLEERLRRLEAEKPPELTSAVQPSSTRKENTRVGRLERHPDPRRIDP